MIYLWSGKTGSGKTFKMVQYARKWYKNGINIYSNIKLSFEHLKQKTPSNIYYFDSVFDIFDVRDGLIIFDDAGATFNAKSWEAMPIEFTYKLMLHRHHHLDMFATVPNIRSVHIDYRRLVQKWFHCKCFISIGSEKKHIFSWHKIIPKDIDDITIVEDDTLARNELNIFQKQKRGKHFLIYKGRRKMYDTHANISFKRYKSIWSTEDNKTVSITLPKEMSLAEGTKIIGSLRRLYDLKNKKKLTRS